MASSFLDEDRNTDLIRWTSSGNSFVVLDEDEFARTLIPELFKHNNYASFVRQLNMYGFHKKVGLSDNSMRASERKNKSPSEYYNPYFKKGKPHLLWLIQKPKPAGKKRAEAQEDGNVDENGDEIFDVDVTTPMNQAPDDSGGGMRNTRAPLMIGPGGNGSGIPHEDLSAVHQELQQIRQQQQIISGVIKKIRRDHEQLYGQAAAFQELHSRHENSINAILTFLATVYNRSLEGHGAQNLANLFAGAIPHDAQHQGSVVDVGDVSTPDGSASNSQLRRPVRRAPLLLKAPPANSKDSGYGHSSDALRAESGAGLQQRPQTRSSLDTSQGNTYLQVDSPDARSGTVQEIFDQSGSNRSSESPQFSAKDGAQRQLTDHDILSFINSENANGTNFGENRMDFPEALSHLQTADGKSPLTTNQRNNVLQMIANGSAATSAGTNNNNNALTSPNAQVPDIPSWNATKEELDFLEKTLKEQDSKVANLSNMLQPLSPSGSIPGLTDSQTYGGNANSDPLDFDQLFNSGDYFNDNGANNDINFDGPPGDFNSAAEFDFGDPLGNGVTNGFDSDTQGEQGGRIVETVGSSEATTPANTAEDGAVYEAGRSPRKRRRRN